MKNFDSLESDLEALSAPQDGPATPASQVSDTQRELHTLRELLKSASAGNQRTPQHQEWAWTRCCAQMRENPTSPSLWFLINQNMRWLGTGAAVALVALVTLPYFTSPVAEPLPIVTSNSASISAVPFHSPKAQADVIWVSGYNYLPASYSLR